MMWLLTKPRVELLEAKGRDWVYLYERGADLVGMRVFIEVRIRNAGGERTSIDGSFTTSDGHEFCLAERNEFRGGEVEVSRLVELEGQGRLFVGTLPFDLHPSSDASKIHGDLYGCLVLRPWGNRRGVVGRKELKAEVIVRSSAPRG